MKKSARKHLVPCALGAAAFCALFAAGCARDEGVAAADTAPKADPPSVYMNDPVFKKALADRRSERNGILSLRSKLVAKAEKMVEEARAKMPGADDAAVKAELEKNREWVSLVARIEDANKAYEENRLATTKTVRERISPKKRVSEGSLKK